VSRDILDEARSQALHEGSGLDAGQVTGCLNLPEERLSEMGMLGGINAIIVGNYLTTLGCPAEADLDMLTRLKMPIKALSVTL
jgi:biotin synthase-like enzyme